MKNDINNKAETVKQNTFNHNNLAATLRYIGYIGITQDEMDEMYDDNVLYQLI